MIQGDNMLEIQNSSKNIPEMDYFNGAMENPRSIANICDNNLSASISIDGCADPELLYAINSSEFIRCGENFDINDFVNDTSLLKEEVAEEDNKEIIKPPKNDVFPDLTEHDNENLGFQIIFSQPENLTKNNWYYSSELKKIFINLSKTFYFEIEHKAVDYQIFLRIMMVFTDEISLPVQRCRNHIFMENGELCENKKFSIIHSENPRAIYCGDENGKNIKDRLSVLIPLSNVSSQNQMTKQSIALKFGCQNSCIGRKQTAVIFSLENTSGCILSKRVVNIKVCSCPKRDKAAEEDKLRNVKRTADRAHLALPEHRPGKIAKIAIKQELNILSPPMSSPSPAISEDNNSNHNPLIKMEIPSNNFYTGVTHLSDGGVNLSIKLPNDRIAREIIKNAYNCISGEISRNPRNSDWTYYLEELKKIEDK